MTYLFVLRGYWNVLCHWVRSYEDETIAMSEFSDFDCLRCCWNSWAIGKSRYFYVTQTQDAKQFLFHCLCQCCFFLISAWPEIIRLLLSSSTDAICFVSKDLAWHRWDYIDYCWIIIFFCLTLIIFTWWSDSFRVLCLSFPWWSTFWTQSFRTCNVSCQS